MCEEPPLRHEMTFNPRLRLSIKTPFVNQRSGCAAGVPVGRNNVRAFVLLTNADSQRLPTAILLVLFGHALCLWVIQHALQQVVSAGGGFRMGREAIDIALAEAAVNDRR